MSDTLIIHHFSVLFVPVSLRHRGSAGRFRRHRRRRRRSCLRLDRTSFPRGEIGHADHQPADQILGLVDALDAGENGAAVVAAEADREFQQLCARHVLGFDHADHAEIDLGEIVEADGFGQRLGHEASIAVEGQRRRGRFGLRRLVLAATIASTCFGSTRFIMCENFPTGVPRSGRFACSQLVIGSPSRSPVCFASLGNTGAR